MFIDIPEGIVEPDIAEFGIPMTVPPVDPDPDPDPDVTLLADEAGEPIEISCSGVESLDPLLCACACWT